MSIAIRSPLPAWQDEFRAPSAQDITSHYPAPMAALFQLAHEKLSRFDGVQSEMVWQGAAWGWTITMQRPDDDAGAWAHLAPTQEKPTISIPISRALFDRLPRRRLRRSVRDGLALGRWVDQTLWPAWEIGSADQVDLVLDIARRKDRYLTEMTAQNVPPTVVVRAAQSSPA